MEKLAEEGLRFTDFHTASACSPTRSMLLSGTDNHIAGLGQMAEFARNFPQAFKGKPGYEGSLNYKVAALSEILHDSGYFTFLSGKWHLGLLPKYWPSARGFEKSFTLLPGAGNHYKYFPRDEKTGEFSNFMAPLFEEDGHKIDPSGLPDDYYSSDYFTDKFLEKLNDKVRNDRPFLGLLTFTAPHWPYQAPPELIEKYAGVYDNGPRILRSSRIANATKRGIIPDGIEPHSVWTQRQDSWENLPEKEKKTQSKIMEIYAAMVDRMDYNIGRVITELKKKDEYDNTFILFMSDNGAEGMLMEAMPLKSQNFSDALKKYYNNSFKNLGKKDSFVWYSDEWAQAATAPSYMYKMWASEGGIRCPLVVHYPALIKKPDIKHEFVTVMDILPTILDIAGVCHPESPYHGREIVEVRGKSWLPFLIGKSNQVHSEDTVTGWELFSQLAIRKGQLKALFIPKPYGPGVWQLFDLSKDPAEMHDLSQSRPEKLNELINHWAEYVAETGLVETNISEFDMTKEMGVIYTKKKLYD
ncbi:hypothetical protein FOA43_003263 [Brettanomyces nanus]|uniref:Sulfatase N-terminal domain-containing protein n=1 Tax=Eeniella nana TaxID=13502 RepID=A0A875RVX2_EENNA|nr:uncharacterized protein FOA43_003263 [Brettanomyces nanus]QPG75877.1 hypothetical protein FOA43_003263 [Brettanomyces nanus]